MVDDKQYIELDEHLAIIGLPEETVEVTIIAKVYREGEIQEVEKVMSMADTRKAFQLADDNYFDPDARYVLTEEGRAFAEELLKDEQHSG